MNWRITGDNWRRQLSLKVRFPASSPVSQSPLGDDYWSGGDGPGPSDAGEATVWTAQRRQAHSVHHHSTAKPIEFRAGAHERARGAKWLFARPAHGSADKSNRHPRLPHQRQRPSCGGRWWLQISHRSFRHRTAELAPLRSAARPIRRNGGCGN